MELLIMTTSFNKQKHEYLIDGKRATGVTTIIGVLAKPQLIGWAARMAVEYIEDTLPTGQDYRVVEETIYINQRDLERILDEARFAHTKKKEAAGTHGTDAHALVEAYVNACIATNKGEPLAKPPTISEGIEKFILWAIENVDHFLFSERQMYNKELFIAGTADFAYIGKDGKKYMADFKTSSGIYGIDYWLQCAAYRMLAEGEGDAPYDGCTVVRMGKDGSFEAQSRFDYETDKGAFLACLTLYRAQATYKPKK